METFLRSVGGSSSRPGKGAAAEDDIRRQLESEKSRSEALEKQLAEARAATMRAETKAKEEEEKKAKSITLLKWVGSCA